MNDKIREILKSIFDSANYRDMNNVTDKIIIAITPYLSHGITEAEARAIAAKIWDFPYIVEGKQEFIAMTYSACLSLGLIVEPEQSEPVEQQSDAVAKTREAFYTGEISVENVRNYIKALEAENVRLRQVPEEPESLVKARDGWDKRKLGILALAEITPGISDVVDYIRELEARVKQLEDRT